MSAVTPLSLPVHINIAHAGLRNIAGCGYRQGPLADTETCLHALAEKLRRLLPICRAADEPAEQDLRPPPA